LALGGRHKLRVRFRHPAKPEVEAGYRDDALFCGTEGEWEPNPRVSEVFEDLAFARQRTTRSRMAQGADGISMTTGGFVLNVRCPWTSCPNRHSH
jgi:hypothetical protein